MGRNRFANRHRAATWLAWAMLASLAMAQQPAGQAQPIPAAQPLAITTASLPQGVVEKDYRFQLAGSGGTLPHEWRLRAGVLPPGVELDARAGVLAGRPQRGGEYRFVIELRDAAKAFVAREFTLIVSEVLAVRWRTPPAAQAGGIAGSLTVTSHASDALELTVIVVAVNEIGRATALGYQRLTLPAAAGESGREQIIPFGSALPRGTYIVHADAIGEVDTRMRIYRARLQSPALTVEQ